MDRREIYKTKQTVEGLCRLARKLGYKDPCYQLMNNDGSCVGDLLYFFEDNPGAIECLINWIDEYHGEDEEDDEDEESD